ncbi:hypothetical protein PHLCEN_2v7990 [Hermanssonia centrifuga]|uniref:Uncharacterized protein n=1 Tax=Hermanssonia centrifuga TaxID=98765 RepID=A0A2R6NUZ6_9APHY|nr:hypothetical protein PHLCEN_2v7990 [Hermanssonia centrifuga]
MNVYGVGSLNSPIVISDDEDEATVELELEQRLSSPRAGIDDDYDTYNDSYNIQQELEYSKSPHQNVFPCDETDETSMNGVAFGTPSSLTSVGDNDVKRPCRIPRSIVNWLQA